MSLKKLQILNSLKISIAAVATSIACCANAHAAESVLLQYQDRQRTITTESLETFAETGEATSPDLRAFFDENPEVAKFANTVLNTEIFVSPEFLNRLQNSSFGEFILIQLNRVMGTPSGNENLEPIRVALASSLADDRFSIIQIVQNYPGETIRLDFTRLQPVVRDVKAFIERVEPALQVAREFLQNIVCDCETVNQETTDATNSEEGEVSSPDAEDDAASANSKEAIATLSTNKDRENCQSY